jgi:CRISPR-associated protein Csm2
MPNQPTRPAHSPKPNNPQPHSSSSSGRDTGDIKKQITETIHSLTDGLHTYPIRKLVEQAEQFGPYLKQQRLETNQVRKFLDAVNRIKAELPEDEDFTKIETDIVLLKPKLAYAAARQPAAKPLSDVMSIAIDQVHSIDDFKRLAQFLESIIAYHKAEGGK